MRVTILGEERECRRLSGTDLKAWTQYVYYEQLRTFYSDLYSRVDFLPEALQVAVFQQEQPPDRPDPHSPGYYRVALTPAAVRYLLELVATDWTVEVTEDNAEEILLSLTPVFRRDQGPTLDTAERQQAAQEIFDKLEGNNGG
jgi:hypothetical protein